MALPYAIIALLFALALAHVDPLASHVVKGSVSCHDCLHQDDLFGIRVLVKCDQVKKLSMATTDENGSFEADIPSDSSSSSSSSSNCLAKVLGGPKKLCSSKKTIVSKIVKGQDSNSYTISTPLRVSTSCPLKPKVSQNEAKSGTMSPDFDSSKTVDLPVPPEFGLAPSSYYFPVIPIIGIP